MGETTKAHNRRLKENWFKKYAPDDRSGIDIGCQIDPLNDTFRRWDIIFGDSDATFLKGISDNKFHTVYASHILEHLEFPVFAIQNWYRVLRPGGHLIINVPHRDLYECKKELPSFWNQQHRIFWLPDQEEPPYTLSLKNTVLDAIVDANIILFRILNEGYSRNGNKHPGGEYSIECIVQKPFTKAFK